MVPHISLSFISLMEWKSDILRVLLNRFHAFQNSKQASLATCVKQFKILLLFMMNFFYSNRLIWGGTLLCRGNDSMTPSYFVLRWMSIFWITTGWSLDKALCLILWEVSAVKINYPDVLSMLAMILNTPPNWWEVSIPIPKTVWAFTSKSLIFVFHWFFLG